MSMPKIPEQDHRPDLKCVLIDLFESIALEEISLSHLLNAEAEKIQAFVGEKLDFPLCNDSKRVIEFGRFTTDFLDKIIMKQWLLLTKLNKIMELNRSCLLSSKCSEESREKCEDCTRPLKKFCQSENDKV